MIIKPWHTNDTNKKHQRPVYEYETDDRKTEYLNSIGVNINDIFCLVKVNKHDRLGAPFVIEGDEVKICLNKTSYCSLTISGNLSVTLVKNGMTLYVNVKNLRKKNN